MCECEKKIQVHDIKIIVDDAILVDSKLKPYYEIMYRKVGRKYHNIGFGSYNLENVIKWRKEMFEVVESKSEQQREEMKETKEINEESKLDVLKRKIDTLLESQATIMNAIGSEICMSEIKDEDLKMRNATLEDLIDHRDECMKEVHRGSY